MTLFEKLQRYNKFWVALLTALVTATPLLADGAQEWVAVVVAFAGALGVYAAPNRP